MINIKEKIYFFLNSLLKRNDAHTRYMLGSIFLNQAKKDYHLVKNLDQVEYKVFSQTGEDGILNYLISTLNISNCKFVEIGVGEYLEANTRYIYENSFSEGLIIDIEKNFKKKVSKNIHPWKGLLYLENIQIKSTNIDETLNKYNLNNNLDVFSVDIDGIDYWVINELKSHISKIFVAEYNPTFGHNLEITVPNDENFSRFQSHYSGCYYGASLRAIIGLMDKKGYDFIGTNKLNFNAFFITKNLSEKFIKLRNNLKDMASYTSIKIRDSKDVNGKLNFLNQIDRLKLIEDKEIIDVSNSKHKKFKIKEIISKI